MTLMEGRLQEDIQHSGDSKPYNFSVIPHRVEKHFEFIDISEDGYLLLGSSNLVSNYWNGNFWYFNNADLAPEKEHSLTGHGCDYSLACGKFIENKNKVIIGDDSGAVTIYSITTYTNSDTTHVIPQMSSHHHDNSVIALSITSNKMQTISAGNDLAINIWDNESMISEHKYVPAHPKAITSVAAIKDDSSMFASCSLDGTTLLWDPRLSKPASCINQNTTCGLTALSWKNSKEIAVGSEAGTISITDIRCKKEILANKIMDCSIHNIVFNSKGLLGVCGDSTAVKIWDSESNFVLYTDERHTGLVRGLAWHPQTQKLYSCGFDKKIYSHQVAPCSES